MGLFDRLFGRSAEKEDQPEIRFGRYSDSYKADEQYQAWHKSMELFDDGKHFDAYEAFFDYLKDPFVENVSYQRLGDTHLSFEFFQGSKLIRGYTDGRKFFAKAKVVSVGEPNVGFMRRLIEKNFALKYSRFALDENDDIAIIFDSYILDGSPHKLYYALRELSTEADKMDDILLDEFDTLSEVDSGHTKALEEKELQVKCKFIRKSISALVLDIDTGKTDPESFAQGTGYRYLDLLYRLDYLIRPEGHMMEVFERLNRRYFLEDGRPTISKNNEIKREFQKLVERTDEEIRKELYETTSTFGNTQVVDHARLGGFINEVIREYDWYMRNDHPEVARSILGYIVGYALFHWAMPIPERELLHLYYEITEPDYFADLGFEREFYKDESGKLDKSAIRSEINSIVRSNRKKFPKLNADTGSLIYTDKDEFCRSFLLMIQEMDLTPAD